MERKIAAGATFIITQPLIEKNAVVDDLLARYPDMPVIVFFELGIALLLVIVVWGWLRWHRPRDADNTTDLKDR